MRIPFILTAALVAAPFAARAAGEFLDYPAALAAAKASGKDILVLADGPGWAPDSGRVRAALASDAARRSLGDRVLWGVFEYESAGAPDAGKPAKKKGAEPEVAPWNLPALLVVDPEGRVGAMAEGLRHDSVGGVLSRVPALLDARKRRDDLWAKARAAAGPERAKLLGAGLDLMPLDRAVERKDIIDDIRKSDAKDSSGYLLKYTFDASAYHEGRVDKLIAEKKVGELLAGIDRDLANPRLTVRQKQVLLTGKFQALRGTDRLAPALDVLRRIVAMDPRNDMGRGAANYLKLLTEPVRLDGREWTGRDNRAVWLPMVADVSDSVKAPGVYEVEFRHKSGHTRFAKTAFVCAGKEIAVEANPKESRKVRLTVEKAPAGPVELRADSRGTGWFEGAGEIVVTKVN